MAHSLAGLASLLSALLVAGCPGEPIQTLPADPAESCEPGSTRACGHRGMQDCGVDSTWDPCEECNGTDDDGDGQTDEFCACAHGETSQCLTSCYTLGRRICGDDGWWSACVAMEACNGGDDDCDGEADEDFECVRGSSEPCITACGSEGIRVCERSAGGRARRSASSATMAWTTTATD